MTRDPHQRDSPQRSPHGEALHADRGDAARDPSGVPLNEVFRALAEDIENGRLSRASSRLADELDRGVDLKTAMRSIDGERLPAYLYRSLVASVDVGQTAALLQGLARHQTTSKHLRRQVRSALLYPAVVLLLFAAVVMGLLFFVVPEFRTFYEDFGLTLPTMTLVVLEAADSVPWAILAALLILPLCLLVGLLPGGRRLVHWLRTGAPVVGRLWIWSCHHEFASALGALVSQGVVLDEAIACTAASLSDRNLARASRIVARKCENGVALSQAMAESIHFDRALTGLLAWGEANDALPEALRQAAAMYEKEIDLQMILLRRMMPPLLFIGVTATLFTFTVTLMIPLVDLINNLSGW
ncbi:MAG: type II secretion system F family protein [Pirellulales bacterium]|nr:type II secretion system F family protein [Pirellulales bacterium]